LESSRQVQSQASATTDMINAARNLFQKYLPVEWLIPLVFCLILLAQLLFSVQQMSEHPDESVHLYAGYRLLRCGDYSFGREHPPLAKVLAAVPLLWSNPPMNCSSLGGTYDLTEVASRWLYSQDNWWALLMQARIAASFFSVTLCLAVWIVARRTFGLVVAVVSMVILVFEPNILSQGALVLNNVLLTGLYFIAVFCFHLWSRHRSVSLLVTTGVLTGLALLTKHSAVLLIATLAFLAVVEPWLEKRGKRERAVRALGNIGGWVAIVALAVATIWIGYSIGDTGQQPTSRSDSTAEQPVPNASTAGVLMVEAARSAHLLPQPYLDGLIDIHGMITDGFDAPILGRLYSEAPWYFYPLTLIIKFSLPFLAILAMGGAGIIAMRSERRTDTIFLLLPTLLFLAASMLVRRTSGIWHLLPMFPFLIIAAAAGCVYLARRYRWGGAVLVCLLVLHAASSLHSFPNYPSYANEAWGGPRNLYKRLPLTDLGESLWQVSKYMEQHPNTPCWIDSDWFAPTYKYNVPCVSMGAFVGPDLPTRMKGIVFVSSTYLEVEGQPGGPLAPFYASEPKDTLGGSAILIYEGEFDTTVAAARALDQKALSYLSVYDVNKALPLAKRAAEMARSYAYAHEVYCVSLDWNGEPRESLAECSVARNLALADGDQKEVQNITRQIKGIAQRSGLQVPPGVE
jgi:4-amino-4-deoxy-L-arabinose transferase-like glycosyltransferase